MARSKSVRPNNFTGKWLVSKPDFKLKMHTNIFEENLEQKNDYRS